MNSATNSLQPSQTPSQVEKNDASQDQLRECFATAKTALQERGEKSEDPGGVWKRSELRLSIPGYTITLSQTIIDNNPADDNSVEVSVNPDGTQTILHFTLHSEGKTTTQAPEGLFDELSRMQAELRSTAFSAATEEALSHLPCSIDSSFIASITEALLHP